MEKISVYSQRRLTSTFHTLVFLIAVLIFSAPLVARAQQSSAQTEAEAAAAQDINVVHLQAKTDAESDANSDINKLACLSAGASAAIIGGSCGISYMDESYIEPGLLEIAAFAGGFAMGAGIFSALIGTYSYPPSPPPEKLIGKSPEYVMVYAEAYRKKTLSLRMKSAVTGAAIGGSGCVIFSLAFLLNQVHETIDD